MRLPRGLCFGSISGTIPVTSRCRIGLAQAALRSCTTWQINQVQPDNLVAAGNDGMKDAPALFCDNEHRITYIRLSGRRAAEDTDWVEHKARRRLHRHR